MKKSYAKISWQKFNDDCTKLAKRLRDKKFDWIVAISRGGLVPARILSDILDLPITHITIGGAYRNLQLVKKPIITEKPNQSFKNKKILIVDEIVDSGNTMKTAVKYCQQFPGVKIETFAPYIKTYSEFVPDYHHEVNDNWVIFPWEKKETIGAFGRIFQSKIAAKNMLTQIGYTASEIAEYL